MDKLFALFFFFYRLGTGFAEVIQEHMDGYGGGGGEVLLAPVVFLKLPRHDVSLLPYGDPYCPHEDVAVRRASGACVAGDGNGEVRVEEFVGTQYHLARHFLADGCLAFHEFLADAEQPRLHVLGIAAEAAAVVGAAAGGGGDDGGNASGRAAFGRGDGFLRVPEELVYLFAGKFQV